MTDIPIDWDNNCLLFKNNVKYRWAKYMQASKMSKELIYMFFDNANLALMQQYLSHKNINEIKTLLIKLSYDKVI